MFLKEIKPKKKKLTKMTCTGQQLITDRIKQANANRAPLLPKEQ